MKMPILMVRNRYGGSDAPWKHPTSILKSTVTACRIRATCCRSIPRKIGEGRGRRRQPPERVLRVAAAKLTKRPSIILAVEAMGQHLLARSPLTSHFDFLKHPLTCYSVIVPRCSSVPNKRGAAFSGTRMSRLRR